MTWRTLSAHIVLVLIAPFHMVYMLGQWLIDLILEDAA